MSRKITYRVFDKKIKQYLSNPCDICIHKKETESDEYIIELSTGLKDKNNKEICEGDIISWNNEKRRLYENGEVIWSKEYITYLVKFWSNNEYYSNYIYNISLGTMEIIGNINQNKELLKKQKEGA